MHRQALATLGGALIASVGFRVGDAVAHETWLMPGDFSPPAETALSFQMTSGMGFPALGSTIGPERIVEAYVLNGKQRFALDPQEQQERALILRAAVSDGVSCAWVQLRPRVLEMPDPQDVRHYLEEIGAGEAVWTRWQPEAGHSLWRESYSKLARSYLRTPGSTASPDCITAAPTSRFDLQPLNDPTRLGPGDRLGLQVLFEGKPLAGQPVAVQREGDVPQALQRSGDDGRLQLNLPEAGRYMVYATMLRPADGETFNWESDFVTLTLEVTARNQ